MNNKTLKAELIRNIDKITPDLVALYVRLFDVENCPKWKIAKIEKAIDGIEELRNNLDRLFAELKGE